MFARLILGPVALVISAGTFAGTSDAGIVELVTDTPIRRREIVARHDGLIAVRHVGRTMLVPQTRCRPQ